MAKAKYDVGLGGQVYKIVKNDDINKPKEPKKKRVRWWNIVIPIATAVAGFGACAGIIASARKNYNYFYTVKFDTNGGTTVTDQKIIDGEKIAQPKTEKAGFYLVGWKNGDNFWDFEKDTVKDNITLKAEWEQVPIIEGFVDLLSLDITNPEQHAEASLPKGNEGLNQAGEMYFKGEGLEDVKKHVSNDLIYQLAEQAKTLAVAEMIDPGCIEGFDFVGKIETAHAKVDLTNIEYKTGSRNGLLSGTVTLVLTAQEIDENKKQIGDYTLITQHNLKKVKYEITDYNEGTFKPWSVRTTTEILQAEDNWAIDRFYYGVAMPYEGEVESATDTKNWKKGTFPTKDQLKFISWDSVWMNTVEHETE